MTTCLLYVFALAEEPNDPYQGQPSQEEFNEIPQEEAVQEQELAQGQQFSPEGYAMVDQAAQGAPPEVQSFTEDLRMEINMLNFNRDASADELRMRHELVGKIAAVSDPNLRHELLAYLESREKEAESLPF